MYGWYLVLRMVGCGAVAVAAWDLFAALNKALDTRGIAGGIIDFLSPVSFGMIIWYCVLCVAGGATRVYEFICMGMGAVLYIFTAKRLVYKLFYVLFLNIFKFLRFIFKILLTPARFLYKMIYVGLYAKRSRGKTPVNGDDINAEKNRLISGTDAQKSKE